MRYSAKNITKNNVRGMIKDLVSISERPPEVEDRAIPGHWEGDLLCGSQNTYIATLVERKSRYLMLVQLDGKDTITVTQAIKREMITLPEHLGVHSHGTVVPKLPHILHFQLHLI